MLAGTRRAALYQEKLINYVEGNRLLIRFSGNIEKSFRKEVDEWRRRGKRAIILEVYKNIWIGAMLGILLTMVVTGTPAYKEYQAYLKMMARERIIYASYYGGRFEVEEKKQALIEHFQLTPGDLTIDSYIKDLICGLNERA